MRRCLTEALIAVALSVPLPALAQECPPGSWFCEEVEVAPPPEATPAPPNVVVEVPPPPAVPAPPAPPVTVVVPPVPPRVAAPPPPPPPRVVVVQSDTAKPAPQIVIIAPGARPVPPPPPVRVVRRVVTTPAKPAAIRKRWKSEFGVNLRLEGIALGKSDGDGEEARMGGLGLSLRYRPWRAFALDAGVDVIGGVDYNGDKRMELPLSLNGLLYVNPRSRVQFYFMGGIHWSRAKVELPSVPAEQDSTRDWSDEENNIEYTYFGGQLGAGLDFRLWRHVSLFIDGVGFMRKRTDDNARPEFTNPDTGQTTNSSGGGIFRGGLTIWW